ncbi:asparagine synthase (glutamine-hydrolyzing) [Candidatus Uhrbacteria bacterium]|nr:asparagine synthase (glutamine-hydrolyzing) [Candidatus Uhrbacteria bacterium]
MCGIAGELRFDQQPVQEDRLSMMGNALAHRGPDGGGVWLDGSVGFVHRRLAIVDLSPAGTQPMKSADGSLILTFNGEIYNYQELRQELEMQGQTFRSGSDTEILLALYQRFGEQMLAKLRGMFAFAMWDAPRKRLFFARDRLGKKPFFYRFDHTRFQFASELKALVLEQKPSIDWQAIRLFLGLQYIPSPMTGFEGILSLAPATYGVIEQGTLKLHEYDTFPRQPKYSGSMDQAADQLRGLLEESVRLRMIADVPVGAFLSGGIDSSLLVALMARQSSKKIQTFTMGFPSFGFDERAEARAFAQHLGTDHHEFEARSEDAAALVDQLIELYDAPYADSSSLPVWLLARETKKSVKAVICGDGGDELFGGYRRYQAMLMGHLLHQYHLAKPAALAAQMIGRIAGDPRYTRFAQMTSGFSDSMGAGYAALFEGSYFSAAELETLLLPEFKQRTQASSAGGYIRTHFDESCQAEGALAFDLSSYLVDDLNVKMDRATMAHGLEARAPFLDQELVRFSVQLPLPFLLKRGIQKPMLRAVAKGILSEDILNRPKRGFQVPLADWFRQNLRPMFIERCLSQTSKLNTMMNTKVIQRYLDENDRGVNHGNRLWMLLVLASWLDRYST